MLRIPVLYGDMEYLEESAVTVLLKNLKDVQGKNQLNELIFDDLWIMILYFNLTFSLCQYLFNLTFRRRKFKEGKYVRL